MTLNIHRIRAVARKEFFHIIYDPRTLFIIFLMPVVQLIVFGYAMRLEIRLVDMAVIDLARSPASRNLVDQFEGSLFFRTFTYTGPMAQAEALLKMRRAHAVMVIPADFDRRLERDAEIPVQFFMDGSNANTATLIRNYCQQVILKYNERLGTQLIMPFDLRTSIFFNPDLKSTYFFVPGIIAMILIMISALLTSITIAREKEMGTMEQILVSPIHPQEIIIGKVLPYIALAVLEALVVLIIGLVVFHVPFRGSALLLAGLTTLYVVTGLSLGLMISTRARTQQVAMMMVSIATLLPTIMLSGLIFPIASMPKVLQYLTYIIPARYI